MTSVPASIPAPAPLYDLSIDLSRNELPKYMPQLDALRTFAVVAVWFEHWSPAAKWFPWGLLGVRLFFVLSGFLITGILLRARDAMTKANAPLWPTARNFYARRFLRILPIYYLTLFVVTSLAWKNILPLPGMPGLFKWHVTYLTNVYAARYGYPWAAGMHFWSLAVEEQFYLAWPWLVLLVPRRHQIKMVFGAIALALVFRMVCAMAGRMDEIGMLPFGCIDQFAVGALLAVIAHEPTLRRRWDSIAKILLLTGLPFAAITLILSATNTLQHATFVLSGLTQAMVFAWLIVRAARGFGGLGRFLLQNPPMLFLGRISYGLYIYHPFVAVTIGVLLARTGHALPTYWPLRFATYAMATIAVATTSWFLIERPIQTFKRWFEYVPRCT